LVTAVHAIAELRNKTGDAHGKAPSRPPATAADALLAANSAGVVVTYLLERWNAVRPRP
jgi:hypothetical protein